MLPKPWRQGYFTQTVDVRLGHFTPLALSYFWTLLWVWMKTCPERANPMNAEQLDAVRVIFAGPTGTYDLQDHITLQRASGLQKYIHGCAQRVLVDAIARRGFFAATSASSTFRVLSNPDRLH
jgi:hypothetical protein